MEATIVQNESNKGTFRQFFAATVATVGIFGLGTVLAYTSPALPSLATDDHFGRKNGTSRLSPEENSWIGSIAMLGALVASPLAGIAVDVIGRKRSMLIFALPFIAGWILIGISSSFLMILIGRFITGFCGGAFSLIAPVYISEISENKIRGTLLSLFQLMLVLGILFSYGVGSILNWRGLAWASAVIPLLTLVFLSFIPESPRFLLQRKNNKLQAEKSIRWLRCVNDFETSIIDLELEEIEMSIAASQSETRKISEMFQPHLFKPIAVSLSLMVFEQISGFNAIIFYTGGIFKAAGSDLNENVSSIIVGIVQVVATIGSSIMVDRAGRRVLLLFPQILMGLSLVALGIYFYVKDQQPVPSYLGYINWIPLLSMIIFIIAFSIGIGPLSWTMMGELLPPNVKGTCSSIATALVWLCGFFVTKSFDTVAHALGIYWCFWLFAICCFIGFISIYLTVPETKGKSLEEIQNEFQK